MSPKNTGRQPGFAWRVFPSASVLADAAATFITEAIQVKPALIFGASSGGTPTLTYEKLTAPGMREKGLFDKFRVFQVDEWGGLPSDDPATCAVYLRKYLLQPAGIPPDRFLGFHSDAPDPEQECGRMESWLAANGPIDLCLLGLGLNGHLALNEPSESLHPFCHVAKLSVQSSHHPMLEAAAKPPRYGLTIGLGDIMRSRKVMLLVSGSHKNAMMKRLLDPLVRNDFPASYLWLHPNAVCMCDQAAVEGLHLPQSP